MKVSFKAVIIGGVVDVFLTNILSIPLIAYAVSVSGASTAPKDQVSEIILHTLQSSPILIAAQFLIGGSCSILGGYVAALLSKHDEILNAVLASWLCLGFGAYALVSGKYELSLSFQIATMIATPVYYWIGGIAFLKFRRNKPVVA